MDIYEQRFWNKVDKRGEDDCWEWIGSKDRDGYGHIKIKNKMWVSSRFSYELHTGKIPSGMLICHSCDNPSCVNPKHLWLGTDKDNAIDRNKKGRIEYKSGENSPRAKLTNKQANEIRNLYIPKKHGVTSSCSLAKKYKISQRQILDIVKNKSYIC
jgi:hypothetical protein